MRSVILDSEALSQLARRQGRSLSKVQAALRAAQRHDVDVFVPAAVLAEQYRGGRHNQTVDACLGRHSGIEVRDTDRALAKTIGGLLASVGLGSEHHVDAAVVACAVAAGGGLILTSDPDDITRIAGSLAGVSITIEQV